MNASVFSLLSICTPQPTFPWVILYSCPVKGSCHLPRKFSYRTPCHRIFRIIKLYIGSKTLFSSYCRLLSTKIPLCSTEVVEPQLLNTGKCLEEHWCTGALLYPLFWSPKNWTLLWNGMVIITAIRLLSWQGSKGKTKTTYKSPTISTQIILLICLWVYSVILLYQCKWGDRDLLHQSQQ